MVMFPEAVPQEPDTGLGRVRSIRACPVAEVWDIRQEGTGESGREEMRQVRVIRPAESRQEEMRFIRACLGAGILPADRTGPDRLPDIRRFRTDMVLCRQGCRRISGMDRGISFIRIRVR